MGAQKVNFSPAKSSTATDSDLQVLRRVVERDVAAFEFLFKKYHRRIYQFVFRVLRDPELTDEVVNDVMVVVWENAARFQGASSVSTWIFGIAYRKALKALQRKSRRPFSDAEDDCNLIADPSPLVNPERTLDNQERMQMLQRGMQSLSDEKRCVVELTAMGHSYADISQIVGCPENTVKTRMFHARQRLRAVMHGSE